MNVFYIEILVGEARPLSFFFSFAFSSAFSFFPAFLALAVQLTPLPVLVGDPNDPPSFDGEPL